MTLVVISELVDRDEGIVISFKELANNLEDGFGFVVGCATTNGV